MSVTTITQEYDLNMIPGAVNVRVHVNQYDAGNRVLLFNLYVGGDPYDVPEGADITICGDPGGNGEAFAEPATVTGNSVAITLPASMTQTSGEVACNIRVEDNVGEVASAQFSLVVHRCLANDPMTLERYYYMADVPSGYREAVDQAVAARALTGYSGEGEAMVVRLSKDMCRLMVMMDRMWLFDRYYYLSDVPSGYQDALQQAVAARAITGYEQEGEETVVKLSKDMCRLMVMMDRMGLFNRYYYLSDVPSGYRDAVDAAIAAGAINGYGYEGEELVVKLSQDMCRLLVVMARSGAFDPYYQGG